MKIGNSPLRRTPFEKRADMRVFQEVILKRGLKKRSAGHALVPVKFIPLGSAGRRAGLRSPPLMETWTWNRKLFKKQ
jgi:hypothetical protein